MGSSFLARAPFRGSRIQSERAHSALRITLAVLIALSIVPMTPPLAVAVGVSPVAVDDPARLTVLRQVLASDGVGSDYFGYSVAMSGDTAVVGSYYDDDKGLDSGSAYVFTLADGVWTQQAKLVATDGEAGDFLGNRVAISGDTALIGAYGDDDGGNLAGAAYVFTRSDGIWTQQAKLLATGGAEQDYFGYSVAVSGDTALVGAYGDDDDGSMSGSTFVFTRSGSTWTQRAKLKAADAAAGDQFGNAVALEGDTALIGAYADDDAGTSSGSVYVFVGTGSDWAQESKLTAADGAEYDYLGYSVALSGDTALIGAYGHDSAEAGAGSAYVFTRSAAVWTLQEKLTASDAQAGDAFGRAVALSGDTALIGAVWDDDSGIDSGSAYVFERSSTTWAESNKLTAANGATGDQFGASTALSGGMAVIGAYLDDDLGWESGSVYFSSPGYTTAEDTAVDFNVLANDTDAESDPLTAELVVGPLNGEVTLAPSGVATYTPDPDWSGTDTFTYRAHDGSTYSNTATVTVIVTPFNDAPVAVDDPGLMAEAQKVLAPDDWVSYGFGYAVAISGETAVVGDLNDTAYIFVRSGSTWTLQARLTATGGSFDDYFGAAVAISGDTVLIGAWGDDDNGGSSGAAYVFTRSGDTWTQQAKLKAAADDGATGDYFGISVALSGDTALVGAHTDDDNGTDSGSAYVFTRSGSAWSQQAKLTAGDGAANDYFGNSVGLSGDTALIGARNEAERGIGSGSAYIFTRTDGDWSEQAKLNAADGGAQDQFGGSVALSDDMALIGSSRDDDKGTDSGSAYVFVRSDDAWSQQAKLTAGDGAANDYFGYSVALSADSASIGAYGDDDNGSNSGSAYMFTGSGSTWTQRVKLAAAGGVAGDAFGQNVAISDGTVLVGAWGDDDQADNSGAAYFHSSAYVTSEDISVEFDVLANDTDAEDDPLTASVVLGPSHGVVALAPSGEATYTPAANWSGTDTFTYRAYDGSDYSNAATVTIVVTPVSDVPVAVADAYATAEDTPLTVAAKGVLANDTDADGDVLTADLVLAPSYGELTLDSSGEAAYTPDANWHGTDTFTYRAHDGSTYSNVATVTIVVTPVSDVPVAVADAYATAEDTPLTVAAKGVLANDTDADDDPLTAIKVTDPAHGTVTLSSNGSYTYTPAADYNGSDSFTYKANDGTADSNVVAVTLTVTAVDDPVDPEPLPPIIPIAGDNRFTTAVAASKEAYPDGLDDTGARTVVIATGRNWPDALGGSSLAGVLDGPILLVDTGAVPAEVTAEITRLGADKAIILGGTSAVSGTVEIALKTQLGTTDVTRIYGSNRYETADKTAKEVIRLAGAGYDGTAFVATGGKFPDALGAAPLAAANAWPLYLANPSSGLSAATKAAMAGVDSVLVLGGTAVVSSDVETYLNTTYGDVNVTRLYGSDRYETAVKVATYGVDHAGLGWNRVAIATGINFPDALAGGVLQGKVGSVMLLTKPDALNAFTAAALSAHKADITTVTFFGGLGALPQVVRDQVSAALK